MARVELSAGAVEALALVVPLLLLGVVLALPPAPLLDRSGAGYALTWVVPGALTALATWALIVRWRPELDPRRRGGARWAWVLATLVLHAVVAQSLLERLNGALDPSAPEDHRVELLALETRQHPGGRGTSYTTTYAQVRSWRHEGRVEQVPVPRAGCGLRRDTKELLVSTRRGLFGLEWVSGCTALREW